jgi:hypothetical protein
VGRTSTGTAAIAGVACAALILLTGAAPASANFVGVGKDASGDASSPGRDILAAGVGYDRRNGDLRGGVQLRGSTEGFPSFVTLFAGTSTATGCNGFPAGGFSTFSDQLGASWTRLDSSSGGPTGSAVKRGFDSDLILFEATESELAGQGFNCLIASISQPGNPSNVYDSFGPVPLVGLPAISVRLRAVPGQLARGATRTVKVKVANVGDAPARGVKLRLGSARGLKGAPRKRSLGTIAPGRRETVKLKVTLTESARAVTPLKVKVSSGKLVARQKDELRLRRPKRGGDGGGSGGSGGCAGFAPDISGLGSLVVYPC